MSKIKVKNQKIPRDKEKYPALNPKRAVGNRRELLEIDYLDQLSEKDKDWLNRFNEEFVIANYQHKGKKIDKSKKARKASYDRNNARNRCTYTKAKVTGLLNNTPTEEYLTAAIDNKHRKTVSNMEDVLIETIDMKARLKRRKKLNDGNGNT